MLQLLVLQLRLKTLRALSYALLAAPSALIVRSVVQQLQRMEHRAAKKRVIGKLEGGGRSESAQTLVDAVNTTIVSMLASVSSETHTASSPESNNAFSTSPGPVRRLEPCKICCVMGTKSRCATCNSSCCFQHMRPCIKCKGWPFICESCAKGGHSHILATPVESSADEEALQSNATEHASTGAASTSNAIEYASELIQRDV